MYACYLVLRGHVAFQQRGQNSDTIKLHGGLNKTTRSSFLVCGDKVTFKVTQVFPSQPKLYLLLVFTKNYLSGQNKLKVKILLWNTSRPHFLYFVSEVRDLKVQAKDSKALF